MGTIVKSLNGVFLYCKVVNGDVLWWLEVAALSVHDPAVASVIYAFVDIPLQSVTQV